MKKILLILIFTMTVLLSNFTKDANSAPINNDNFFHAFAAGGLLYSLGSVRVGYNEWEVGLLNTRTFGVVKLVGIDPFYGGFGLVIDNNASYGIFGAAGYYKTVWKMFTFRLEFNAHASAAGFLSEQVLLGLSVHF